MGRANRGMQTAAASPSSLAGSLQESGVPRAAALEASAEVSLAIKKATSDGWIDTWDLLDELRGVAEEGRTALDEQGGFARGHALLAALNPDVRGAALAQAYADEDDLRDYLQERGVDARWRISSGIVQDVIERSLGREVHRSCDQSRQREDLMHREPSGFIVTGDRILPSSEYYEVPIDNVSASVEVQREFNREGVLETRVEVSARRTPRKWDVKEEQWVPRKNTNRREEWSLRLRFSGDGEDVVAYLENDGPCLQGELQEIEVSMKEIAKAGGPADWAEQQLDAAMRGDREWEDSHPKKAQKRYKEDKKRRKKRKKREKQYADDRLRETMDEERERQAAINRIGSRSIREALGGYKPLD